MTVFPGLLKAWTGEASYDNLCSNTDLRKTVSGDSAMEQRVISFHYTLYDNRGEVVDSSRGGSPFTILEGASQIIPGLEKFLVGQQINEIRKVTIPSAEAYGSRREDLVVKVPRERLPAGDIQVGDRFRGGSEPADPVYTVIEVDDKEVTLDGNHPLAGMDLTFDVELIAVRDATREEIDRGTPG